MLIVIVTIFITSIHTICINLTVVIIVALFVLISMVMISIVMITIIVLTTVVIIMIGMIVMLSHGHDHPCRPILFMLGTMMMMMTTTMMMMMMMIIIITIIMSMTLISSIITNHGMIIILYRKEMKEGFPRQWDEMSIWILTLPFWASQHRNFYRAWIRLNHSIDSSLLGRYTFRAIIVYESSSQWPIKAQPNPIFSIWSIMGTVQTNTSATMLLGCCPSRCLHWTWSHGSAYEWRLCPGWWMGPSVVCSILWSFCYTPEN